MLDQVIGSETELAAVELSKLLAQKQKELDALDSRYKSTLVVLDQCRKDSNALLTEKRLLESEVALWRLMFQESVKNVAANPMFPSSVHSILDDVREENGNTVLYTNRARCLSDVISVNELPTKYRKAFEHGACITRVEPLTKPATLQHSDRKNSIRYVFRYRIAPLCQEEHKDDIQ